MTTKFIVMAMLVGGAWFFTLAVPHAAQAEEPKPDQTNTTTPTAEATAEKPPVKYVVQRGDYLSAIAEAHNVSWPTIFEVNPIISNPDVIFADMELTIPAEDVPLTRVVPQEATLTIPSTYQPHQAGATPKASTVAPAPATTAVTSGVPGLGNVLGRPYVAGGNSPATGFDCSGLTQYLAGQKGVSVPRTASGQYQALRHISLAEAWAGDIIVFNLGHVGTYLGGGQVVHALNPAQGIQIENVQTAIKYNGFLSAVAVGH